MLGLMWDMLLELKKDQLMEWKMEHQREKKSAF
jgi:hypothetical protein